MLARGITAGLSFRREYFDCFIAIRIISNTDYLAHSSKLFLNLKLLKLDDIMKFQLGTFMYKLKYNKLPNVIPHYVRH